ncbi:CBASS cGAMP-activated phospholipase [Rhodococcus rhodochrous]|jgi:predicted acylesterase/phospholipase RssA|uniref:CBASS cGAMP-activated phospholipase n=1 Tax=Rhodococcus rhodochrous TaxID=1829 RepID=UPI0011A88857|nr:CBASS cGAMP-activated phospholipase [Rhodococcus rhodochrous]TWH44419.1 Patatin [Rhodococcus rhodochrous J38]
MVNPQHFSGSPERRRFQVLALDGGGAKALFTAHVLARLEADLGVRVADSFDLIAGTSAGGIIALGLGAGMRPAEIVDHYTVLTQKVFPRSRQSRWRYLPRAWGPAYSGDVLRQVLGEVFGPRRLGDSVKRLVIPSWDVQRGEVHIFKTPHHTRLRRDWQIAMVDVAMATTAAPTFFPAASVDGQKLIDGGVWANNPSVVAVGEAVSMLDVPLGDIRVLNVGTVDQRTIHPELLDRGGWAAWAKPAAQLMITASSRGAQGTAMHLVGKENFIRFDANVPGNVFTLDRASPTALAGLAAGQSRVLSPLYTERFADYLATPYRPAIFPGSTPTTPTSAPPGGTA